MCDVNIRLNKITVENLKNIEHGEISMPGGARSDKAKSSVLGIYGQNGSGKTTVVNAMRMLKCLLMGLPLPMQVMSYITNGRESAHLAFEFTVAGSDDGTLYTLSYSCVIGRCDDQTQSNEEAAAGAIKQRPAVLREVLSFSGVIGGNKRISQILADTGSEDSIIIPISKQSVLFGKDRKKLANLMLLKNVALYSSQSFLFSARTLDEVNKNSSDDTYRTIFKTLVEYGNQCLFVVDNDSAGLINMNLAIPFSFKIKNNGKTTMGSFPVSLSNAHHLSQKNFELLQKIVKNMDIVLCQMVPGLNVEIEDLGVEIMKSGEKGRVIQLVSVRNGVRLPLQSESEGIKKIISVLQLLIVLYNNSSMTVVIDELDAGIFEYLLGEILKIISESGKGQLIFTSHNLRPLEILDDKQICFTTTNPKNRFAKLNIQNTNNLRSVYYRDILLGGTDEPLYDKTNNYEIALAFANAADGCDEE